MGCEHDFEAALHGVSSSVDALVCQPLSFPTCPLPLPTSADTGLKINGGKSHVETLPRQALTLQVGPGVTFTLWQEKSCSTVMGDGC